MNATSFRGIAFSGSGIGRHYVELDWVRRQIKEKLGFAPYVGTLNIRLTRGEGKRIREVLSGFKGITIVPKKGFFPADCFRVLVMKKIKGAIVIPRKSDYPENELEILAPVCLRRALSIKDNDEVEITIFA